MVYANLESASSSVADAFRERDITTLATAGGLASVGFVIAVSVGSAIANVLGLNMNSRVGMAALAVGATLGAMAQIRFFGPSVGGAMSIGALVAVGTGVILTIVGPMSTRDDYFRGVVDSADMMGDIQMPDGISKAMPSSACSTCGSSGTQSRPRPSPDPAMQARMPSPRAHGDYR